MSRKLYALAAAMMVFAVACAEQETEEMGEREEMPAAEEPMTQPAPPMGADTMGGMMDTTMADTGMTM